MLELHTLPAIVAFVVAWVGHACVWVSLMSNLYGRPLPKWFLKPWRLFTAAVILAFPLLLWSPVGEYPPSFSTRYTPGQVLWCYAVVSYYLICLVLGGVVFPAVTVLRLLRKPPACVVSETTRTLELWSELGEKLIGDGNLAAVARFPGNGLFRVDVTDLTLALVDLPPEWEGLTLHVVSDLHFHGTPARPFFDRVMDELTAGPVPDLVCLIGDYVDTDSHHEWIGPVLGRLNATGVKLAILGNHDRYHEPPRVREALIAAGYTVLGNGWRVVDIRGVPAVVVGHEGPWFRPGPDLAAAPPGLFRLCLSHTPDNFYWGIANRIGLMLCGHVHGGAIRLPVIG
jgi:hypothetical protein